MSVMSSNQLFAFSTSEGKLLKVFKQDEHSIESTDTIFGFHPLFGWLSENAFNQRLHRRNSYGLSKKEDTIKLWNPLFLISFKKGFPSLLDSNSNIEKVNDEKWKLQTPFGTLFISSGNEALAQTMNDHRMTGAIPKTDENSKKAILIALLFLAIFFMIPKPKNETVVEVLPEPIKVMVMPEKQKVVTVPESSSLNKMIQSAKIENKVLQSAVKQNLGFLGVLGKKDLKNAMGGIPVAAKNVTAGAGAGGTAGSGGEYLTGLGEGVKKGTVGNTGVAGLGGIGTKGAGGGAGGYGNTLVGSGTGKSLSKMALSNDMVLEGGLDRAVIQATISKYLSEVRACYESELQKIPGLSGLVSVNFNIDAGGNVSTANVSKSSLGNANTENCITKRLMNWKFPRPVGGVVVKVNYPFLLRPAQ